MKNHFSRAISRAALAVIAVHIRAAQATEAKTNGPTAVIPLIHFEDVPLKEAVERLARQADLNYLFAPRTRLDRPPSPQHNLQPRVSLNWTNLTARQSLTCLLDYYGLRPVEISGTTVSQITRTNLSPGPVDTGWIQQGTNMVIPLVQMSMVPLDIALTKLARQANLRITIVPKALPQIPEPDTSLPPWPMVSLRWEKITARQAIAALCENYGLVIATDATAEGIQIVLRAPATLK